MSSLFSFPGGDAGATPIRREPNAMVDLTGLTCPGPILGAKEILGGLKDGQVLLLLSDCAGTRDDLYAWARQTGNEVLYTESREDGATAYYLRRGRSSAPSAQVSLDLRGTVCPGPIVEARQLLRGMRAGEVLKLVSDCPGVRDDVAAWTQAADIELMVAREAIGGGHEFLLRKR